MLNLKYKPIKFQSRILAFSSIKHYVKPMRIMLGDDMLFWIVCPADAARLERAGYEYAQ